MAELIVDQNNTEALSTSDNTRKTHRTKDHRLFSKPFLVKITQCRADVRFQITYTIINKTPILYYFVAWNRYSNIYQ